MALDALSRYLERAADVLSWNQVVDHSWGPAQPTNGHTEILRAYHPSLSVRDLIRCYRMMIVSRRTDERELML